MRNSFVFYRSFNEAMAELSESDQLTLYRAIVGYGLDGQEASFDSSYLRMAWKLIKPQLDANWRRYENGCKGGAPVGNRNNPSGRRGNQPKTNQELTKNKRNANDNANDNYHYKESTIVPKKDELSLPQTKISLQEKQQNMAKNKKAFQDDLSKFLDRYSADMLDDFFSYWTEPNKSQTKMRFEQQPTWDLSRRLSRWEKNNYKYEKGGKV